MAYFALVSWSVYYVNGFMGNSCRCFDRWYSCGKIRKKKNFVLDRDLICRIGTGYRLCSRSLCFFFFSFYRGTGNWCFISSSTNIYFRDFYSCRKRKTNGYVPIQYCIWDPGCFCFKLFIAGSWRCKRLAMDAWCIGNPFHHLYNNGGWCSGKSTMAGVNKK